MFENIIYGIGVAFTPMNLLMLLTGCLAGTFIGLLPGLGPISAIALMIPITYGFDPASGMILMAGVYYGAVFGGSTASILINAPGTASTVATSFDGFPLAKQGHPGKALAIAAYASFSGGTIGTLLLFCAAPLLARFALQFQSADYFAMMLFGLTAVAAFTGKGQFLKAIQMSLLGVALSTIGTDSTSGVQRFTLGIPDLMDGISFLLLAMASFALAEVLMNILRNQSHQETEGVEASRINDLKISKSELKEIAPVIGRSSILGFLVGTLPGAGGVIASFLAYGAERILANAREKLKFGKGSLRGLAAPEAANNAACSGSFVPLLTLGIPGSGTTAVMLGALISFGIQPGPRLYLEHPDIFWSVIISMYIGNLVLLILNLPLIPYLARLLVLPGRLLNPLVIFFSLSGVYLVSFNTFELQLMLMIAVGAVLMRLLEFPMPPMLLGFILGGLMEDNLKRAVIINDGSISFLWERPTTLSILLLTATVMLMPYLKQKWKLTKFWQHFFPNNTNFDKK